MNWGTFLTWLVQGVIAVAAVLVLAVLTSGTIKVIRENVRGR